MTNIRHNLNRIKDGRHRFDHQYIASKVIDITSQIYEVEDLAQAYTKQLVKEGLK